MTAAKKSMLNVMYGILGQVIIIGLGIIIPRLVLVSFGSEVNGLLNSVNQIFVYFSLFEAGIGAACLQSLYAPVANSDTNKINGIMSATNIFYRRTGFLYAGAIVVMSLIFPLLVSSELSYGLIVAVILFGGLGNSFSFIYQDKYKILMQTEGYTYVVTNITTLVTVMISIAKAVLLVMGFGVIAVQISGFVINIIQVLIYRIYVKKKYAWVDLRVEPDKKALSQKNATFVHQISSMIFNNTDMIMLTVITRSLKIVSIYSLYNLVTNSVFLMLQQLPAGVDFRMGQLYNTKQENYYPLYHIMETVYLVVGFAVMSVVYVVFLPFMKLYTAGVGDAEYINRLYPFFFVLIPIITVGRFAPLYLINHAGHFDKTKYRAVIESVINLAVSIIGIYFFGIFGALLGTVVALLYRTNDMILYCYKYLMPGHCFYTYKRWIGCFAVFGLIVYYEEVARPAMGSYFSIVWQGIIYGIIFLCIYSGVQAILNPRETKNLFHIAKGYLKRRS